MELKFNNWIIKDGYVFDVDRNEFLSRSRARAIKTRHFREVVFLNDVLEYKKFKEE